MMMTSLEAKKMLKLGGSDLEPPGGAERCDRMSQSRKE